MSRTIAGLGLILGAALSNPAIAETPGRVGVPTFLGGLPELRYQWKDGAIYAYRVKIEAEIGDTVRTHEGVLTYSARINKEKPAASARASEKPTATAFVIHPDGYLLTCAHVVEGASTIEVAVAGKTHKAKVLATDKPNDLALLQIEAKGLPALPLANSDQIEVGQEIRAIGYPLSSVLGDSLKATRGTVSGIDVKQGRKLIQVDAGINPGNSGGPLVNEQGEVVGITSAKLAGSAISNVGFGVPVNYAKTMMAKEKVAASAKGAAARLDGPALVRAVSPSVALVTLTMRDGASATGEVATLRFSGHLTQSERSKQPQRFGIPRPPSRPPSFGFRGTQPDEVKVDALGQIQDSSGGESLPYMLGNAAHLILEPLSEHGEQTWETANETTIIEREKSDSPFGPGVTRRRFGPRGAAEPQEPEGKKHPASERTEYRVGKKDADAIVLHKKYELKTETKEGDQPYLQLTGDGEITFDLKEGVPQEMSYKGAVLANQQNVTLRIPLTVSYKRLSADELKTPAKPDVAGAPNQPNQPAARPARPARPEAIELPDAEIDKNLAALKSENLGERHRAVRALQTAKPTEAKRTEVARALENAAAHPDLHTRMNAIKALAVWGSKESVPVLMVCLESQDPFTRNEALDALAVFADERAIEPVLVRYKDFASRRKAAEVLRKIGQPCEGGLARMLGEEKDIFLRKDICELLKEFGTKASIGALEAASNDKNSFVANAAKEALNAVSMR